MCLLISGIADATTRHIASLVARQKKPSTKRKTRLTSYHPEPAPVVPHIIRTQITELLSQYPSGLLGSMFAVAFNRRFGQELNYERLKFKSLRNLLESIFDIVRIEEMRGGCYRVYGKGNALDNLDSGKYVMERFMKQLVIMCYEFVVLNLNGWKRMSVRGNWRTQSLYQTFHVFLVREI